MCKQLTYEGKIVEIVKFGSCEICIFFTHNGFCKWHESGNFERINSIECCINKTSFHAYKYKDND